MSIFVFDMDIKSDEYYMAMAIREAEAAFSEDEVPIGAVVVDEKGSVVARAHNLTERLNDPTAHAEMQAITAATDHFGAKYLTGCTLYVTLEPCPMCAAALKWAQIGCVVWGADDLKQGYRKFSPELLHPKTVVRSGVELSKCEKMMKDFFASKRK